MRARPPYGEPITLIRVDALTARAWAANGSNHCRFSVKVAYREQEDVGKADNTPC